MKWRCAGSPPGSSWIVTLAGTAAIGLFGGTLGACGAPAVDPPSSQMERWASPDAYAHFLAAEHLAFGGDDVGARDHMILAVESDPEAAVLRLRVAELMLACGDLTAAHRQLDVANRLGARAWEVVPIRAELRAAEGDDAAALQTFETSSDADMPVSYFEAWNDLARVLGDDAGWVVAAQAYADAQPMLAAAWRELALAHWESQDWDPTLNALEQAYMLPGGRASEAGDAIEIMLYLDRYDEAQAAVEVCHTRYREHLPCYTYGVVAAFGAVGESSAVGTADGTLAPSIVEAVDSLARMTSGDTSDMDSAADILIGATSPEVAISYALRCAELRPRNVGTLQQAGWIVNGAGNVDGAIALFEQSLVVDPLDITALNYIGYMWAELGVNLEQAEVYVGDALALRPNDPNVMDSMAWVWFRMGRLDEAAAMQEEALELNGDSAVLLDHLGDIYAAQGRVEDAREAWERGLVVVDPSNPLADSLMEKLLR